MHCLTLYFLGRARPLYIEAPDVDLAAARLFEAIKGLGGVDRAAVDQWARYLVDQVGRHPNYCRMSCEHGGLGLAYHYGRQDKAFALRMRDLGDYPGLSYADCVTAPENA